MSGLFIGLLMSLLVQPSQAQERGRIKKTPKINQPKLPAKEPTTTPTQANPEDEFKVQTSGLRFQSQFEPAKPLNPVVNEDTVSLDEGELDVVEIVDSMLIGDEFVKVAGYYAVWDSKVVDPYGINPLEFDEPIELRLYNPSVDEFWNLPLDKTHVTSHFGPRWGRWHQGTDLDLETGDPIYTTFDGVVRISAWDGRGYGRFVVVRHHNGLETLYGHMSKQLVESGDQVKAGDLLGLGGSTGRSTGPHLHYEIRFEGNQFDPRNIFDWPKQEIIGERFLLTSKVWDHLRGGRSYKGEYEAGEKAAYTRSVLHTVKRGETLSSIASKYRTTATAIAQKNRISTRSTLRIGQKLRVK